MKESGRTARATDRKVAIGWWLVRLSHKQVALARSTPTMVSEMTLAGCSGEKRLVLLAPEMARARIAMTPTSDAASAAPVAGINRRGAKARADGCGAEWPWASALRLDGWSDIVFLLRRWLFVKWRCRRAGIAW